MHRNLKNNFIRLNTFTLFEVDCNIKLQIIDFNLSQTEKNQLYELNLRKNQIITKTLHQLFILIKVQDSIYGMTYETSKKIIVNIV